MRLKKDCAAAWATWAAVALAAALPADVDALPAWVVAVAALPVALVALPAAAVAEPAAAVALLLALVAAEAASRDESLASDAKPDAPPA
jgi:hypothetical protein